MPTQHSSQRRRPRTDIEDAEEEDAARRAGSASPLSASSKRARTNGYQSEGQSASPDPEETNENGSNEQDNDEDEDEDNIQAGPSEFQPGSITRVKLTQFLTFESAEVFCGPSMNMVIGPNGTGKSSLVCAICIGLGYSTGNLDRAKDFSAYIRTRASEAFIEIELQKRPKEVENHVIRVRIVKEGSVRHWWLNGRKTSLKAVQTLVKSFSIQVDNLCGFLPQEKVGEFANMDPVTLLHETQRAAAPQEMLDWHDELKNFRKDQKALTTQQVSDREILEGWETRQQNLHAEVQRLQERIQIQKRIDQLQKTRPFVEYRTAKEDYLQFKRKKEVAQKRQADLERRVEPTMNLIDAKEAYQKQIMTVVTKRKEAVKLAERGAEDKQKSLEAMAEEIKGHENGLEELKTLWAERKRTAAKMHRHITELKSKLNEEEIVFDGPEWNERIRAKEHEIRDLAASNEDNDRLIAELMLKGKENRASAEEAKQALAALDTQEGQNMSKLEKESRDSAKAWKWVQDNRDKFEGEIYGPPLITCSMKDPQYADAVESLLSRYDFLAFTAQNLNDMKTLSDQFGGAMKLTDFTVRTSDTPFANRRPPPVSAEALQQVGLDGWGIDFVDGPEPVLAMLCTAAKLNLSAVTLSDLSDAQFHAIVALGNVNSWTSSTTKYNVSRRSEYGPDAVSTGTRPVPRASKWTNQPVDASAKREIDEKIKDLDAKLEELKLEIRPAKGNKARTQEKIDELKKEIGPMKAEKGRLQIAAGAQKALPNQIKMEEESLAMTQASFDELREERKKIGTQHDHAVLRKAKMAIEYKDMVIKIWTCHESLLEAEIRAIEAESDVTGLKARHQETHERVERERTNLAAAQEALDAAKAKAKILVDVVKALNLDPANEGYLDDWQQLPQNLTVENIDNDLEAEAAKLQFIHAGNPNAITEFEKRQADLDKMKQKIDDNDAKLEKIGRRIIRTREKWEPKLDLLVSQISDAFSHNFEQIGCAGEVGIHKDEDFELWAIQIKVKFRENETLQLLDAHRQSGGERSVSTVFYLMSLQSLARAPFRVVDEINQGMDPRNERLVHERMVEIACKENTSQYFLITPKLLTGLRYDRRMRVLCITSGAHMPENHKKLDIRNIIGIKRAIAAAA